MTPTKKGRRRNVDDTASENSDTGGDMDPMRPWFAEWNLYVTTNETMAKDMKIVQWWGVRLVFLKLYNALKFV
jgi:hypothetical protein